MADEIVWRPSQGLAAQSNVKRFMDAHGIADYDELIRRSTDDVEWFWDAVVRDLGIPFLAPYDRVLDTSKGKPWAEWFIGGRINVAHACIDQHAESDRRDQTALIWEGEDESIVHWSYRQLADETNRLANGLAELGIGHGDTVGLFMPMLPEAVAAFMAISKVGAILVPIFSGFGAEAVAVRLQDAGAKALITADGFYRKGKTVPMKQVADQAVRQSPGVEHVVIHQRAGQDVSWTEGRDRWWHELVEGQPTERSPEETDAEDPFMIIYTSGTTGKPKGAVHVHGGFTVKIAEEVAYQTDLQDGDVLYWVSDMGWIMGPWEVVGGLALGGTVFVYEGAPDYPHPDRLWAMIARHRVTQLGLSPTLIRSLMKHGTAPLEKHDLSSLRIIGSTGEPWNPEPYKWCLEHVGGGRCPIINLSGGTEIGACFLSPHPINELKPCTLRGPSLGMDLDVYDPSGQSVRGSVGELVCKQPWPSMTRGLWKDPDRYLETYWSGFEDVWTHGDWAYVDEDGFWYLQGRSDDTIKVAGKRLGPAEVESALVEHPAVAESAAVGIPDDVKGQAIWGVVTLRPGHEPSDALEQELKERAANQLGKSFTPARIVVVSQLPKTRNAKILRRAVRAVAIGEDLGDLSSLENPESLDEIRQAI